MIRCASCGRDANVDINRKPKADAPICADCEKAFIQTMTSIQGKPPSIILDDVSAIGVGKAGIVADGPMHLQVNNYVAVDNLGPAFELSRGATVSADGVVHRVAQGSNASKAKKPKMPKATRREKAK